jgi:lipoate-protein ligase A
MAVDEALLASGGTGGVATLRLYGWRGPWLSLGYAQPDDAALRARCAAAGVGVVRRSTGGRAVLHGGDLTYALAAPAALLPASLRSTYELISGILLDALGAVGVPATRSPGGGPGSGPGAFDCFAEPAEDEICLAGRKLAGSAQRRAGGAVLQHGSVRVFPDPDGVRALGGWLGGSATSLAEEGFEPGLPALREALIEAFGEALGARFIQGGLTPVEIGRLATRAEVDEAATSCPPRGISRAYPTDR